jgi:hypothetical protein
MSMFKPEAFNFVMLRDFAFPGPVDVFEYRNHPCVDGTPDFLRVSVFLSKDASYVCIWSGLLDTILAEHRLEGVRTPPDTDLAALYQQDVFRGYIETADEAACILEALRLDSRAWFPLPQKLIGDDGAPASFCDLKTGISHNRYMWPNQHMSQGELRTVGSYPTRRSAVC